MVILALDTSLTACSVALLLADGRTVERFEEMPRGHAEALFPMVEAVMTEAGIDYIALGKIAVALGPGSFTGVRAGVAAARGLALAAQKPLVGVGTLEIMARRCVAELPTEDREGGFVIAHDARRDEVYLQCFHPGGAPLAGPVVASLSAALAHIPGTAGTLAGSGAPALAQAGAAPGRRLRVRLPALLPHAGDLARIALNREPGVAAPSPLYLREADAKPQTDKSVARAI
jgi:tRNA threonylcarbamoyladenosine biosynthesis protein TsaB